jgi:signal transduction histidine kinase
MSEPLARLAPTTGVLNNAAMILTSERESDHVMAPLLSVQSLSVRFGPVSALDGIDLELCEGQHVALAGDNGAGKSTLIRCIAGDLAPNRGRVLLDGGSAEQSPSTASPNGVAVVWQDLALCDNLDIAANLLLGQERSSALLSGTRFHLEAAQLLESLGIPLPDTTQIVGTLSGGQRQLLAVARAMRSQPRLLILDEPTVSLGVNESAQVEKLVMALRERGTTVLLASHDVELLFRLAERIVVLRHGRVAADVLAADSHPEEIIALSSGQDTHATARHQLSRLQGLADQLSSADPSSSLSMILSALAAALDTECAAIHLLKGGRLRLAYELGLPTALVRALANLPVGSDGGPVGLAAAEERTIVDPDLRRSAVWEPGRGVAGSDATGSLSSVPVVGSAGLLGVISVFHRTQGQPHRDELDLIALYAVHAASAIEREALLREVTARNQVLETIREMLETLAGPVALGDGLPAVLQALRLGLDADEVMLLSTDGAGPPVIDAFIGPQGTAPPTSPRLLEVAAKMLSEVPRDGRSRSEIDGGGMFRGVTFFSPEGASALVARWNDRAAPVDAGALLEDAANSLRLAHERLESERAQQEASALRRSQELQRGFLSRLSHELRTPLTAIRGYASSLLAADVTWDGESEQRFLSRIEAESARLGRLVNDLLEFSAIESATLRLTPDWCDLSLVLDAAVNCLPPANTTNVHLDCERGLPAVWADHDRLEQVFVNLLENALRHNPVGTNVRVEACAVDESTVRIDVADDGSGAPSDIDAALNGNSLGRRGATAGAGLGLSIARGIIDAHGGTISVEPTERGTCLRITLPVQGPGALPRPGEDHEQRSGEDHEQLRV